MFKHLQKAPQAAFVHVRVEGSNHAVVSQTSWEVNQKVKGESGWLLAKINKRQRRFCCFFAIGLNILPSTN